MIKAIRYGAVIAISLSLMACALHRETEVKPSIVVPDRFSGMTEQGNQKERWWLAFHDQTLNDLMETAFEKNLDLEQAFARLDQMRALTRTAFSAQLPGVTGKYSRSREKTPGFLGDSEGWSYSLSATASYEVDLWGKYYSRTMAAKMDLLATREDILSFYMSLSAQVADLYYLALEQRAQTEFIRSTIVSFEESLKRVERKYDEGLVPALDVYQARQNVAGARARLPIYESNLAVAEHALSVLLGDYPARGISGQIAALPTIVETFPAGLPSELIEKRPDVRAAFMRVKASDERTAAAIADYFPSINLIGTIGKSSTVFSTGDIVGTFWKIVLDITAPLFDGGRRWAEIDRSRAVLRENLAGYQKIVLNAFREVEDALAKNLETERRIDLLEEHVLATGATLRVATERYMNGLSDYLPVLTAQASHAESQSQLIAARRQLLSDRISLARSLGGEWMSREFERRENKSEGERS